MKWGFFVFFDKVSYFFPKISQGAYLSFSALLKKYQKFFAFIVLIVSKKVLILYAICRDRRKRKKGKRKI